MKTLTLLAAMAGFISAGMAQNQLRTNTGAPVGDNQNSLTVGENGPVLLQDIHLVEKLATFDRERIPERVVHARGAGAFGVFESAGDFSDFTTARLFSGKGKTTPVAVRFSTVIHGTGSPETLRDPRGFATKFYTEEGNYDIVGNNLPVFFIRDAIKFPDMVHSLKPSPITNKQDPNRFFDFFSNLPESTHMLTQLYSDRGIPKDYRHMNGSSVHAFKWINAKGEITYVKYSWKTLQGEENLTGDAVAEMQGKDFQHATNDLYTAIQRGEFPKWDLYVQMIPAKDLDKFDFSPLDPTKDWPTDLIPLVKVGTMTLNQNPVNYFEEVEQLAFSPGSLIPGIEASEDKLLQGRLFSYFDTQRYRLGGNFQKLPVNAPKITGQLNYGQDGEFDASKNTSDVNYQPSNKQGELNDNPGKYKPSSTTYPGPTGQKKITKTNDFQQPGNYYRSLTKEQQDRLIRSLGGDLKQVTDRNVQIKMIRNFYQADQQYGTRLAEFCGINVTEISK